MVNQAHNDGYRHLVAKVPKEQNIAESYLKENGFQFILETVELRKDNLTISSLPENIFPYDGGEDERLLELTRGAFSSGTRFHLDDFFSTEKATELHEQWMVKLIKSPNTKILTYKSCVYTGLYQLENIPGQISFEAITAIFRQGLRV